MNIFDRSWKDEPPPRLFLPLNPSPRFETSFDTHRRRHAVLNALVAHRPDAEATIGRIAGCRGQGRCGSGACPLCNRRFRDRLHCEAVKALRDGEHEIVCFSLIPRDNRFEVGSLADLDLTRWTKSRHRALSRALPDDALVIAGTDVSLNTFENADSHWCAHLYGFILLPKGWGVASKRCRARLREAIAARCPLLRADDRVGVEVPLKLGARSWDTFRDTLLYAQKAGFYRRSRYRYTKHKTGKVSTNVVAQKLKAAELAEASMVLDQSPLGSRLILIGLRRRGGFADFKLHREADRQSSRVIDL